MSYRVAVNGSAPSLSPTWNSPQSIFSAFITSSHLLCGTSSGLVLIFSLPSLHFLKSLELHKSGIFSISSSNDCNFILTAGRDDKIKIVKNMNKKDSETILSCPITTLAYCPQHSKLVYADFNKSVHLKSLKNTTTTKTLFRAEKKIWLMRMSDDCAWLLTSGHEEEFILSKLATNEQFKLNARGGEVTQLEFCFNNSCIISANSQGSLVMWSIEEKKMLHRAEAGASSIKSLTICKSFMIIIIENLVLQWTLTLNFIQSFEFFDPGMAVISSDQQKIIVLENRKIVKLVDLEKSNQDRVWTWPSEQETCFVKYGELLAFGGSDGVIRAWDSKRDEWRFVICIHKSPLKSLASKGEVLVSCSTGLEVKTVKYSNIDKNFKISRKMRVLLLSKKKVRLV